MAQIEEEFERMFWHRDDIKSARGLKACEIFFQEMHERDQNNRAITLNYGICLLENGNPKKAEYILGELCGPPKFTITSDKWRCEAVKFYTSSIREREKFDAIQAIFDRLDYFEEPYASDLICHAILNIVDYKSFPRLLNKIENISFKPNYSCEAMRKFYELASAVNMIDKALPLLSICKAPDQIGEINKIQLLYGFFEKNNDISANEHWKKLYFLLPGAGSNTDDVFFKPFDAYRFCLQMHQRIGFHKAIEEIERLSKLRNENFHCYWPLGALLEASGEVDRAIDAYHRAGFNELKLTGQDVKKIAKINREKVKISCIALSFNDAAMVDAYCENIRPHCDELIVNDGGSTDGTIEAFEKFSSETGFPIHIIRDQQASFRDRNLFNKDGYRSAGVGGVKGFEADRRRSTTLMLAKHEYVLLADLDDFFPKYPNLKSIVAGNFGIDHIAGSKREYINEFQYCDLYQEKKSAMPTLFRRDRMHVFSGISEQDEYLANMNYDLALFATNFMETYITRAYNFWHLKWVFDSSGKTQVEGHLGVKYVTSGIAERPDTAAILAKARSSAATMSSLAHYRNGKA